MLDSRSGVLGVKGLIFLPQKIATLYDKTKTFWTGPRAHVDVKHTWLWTLTPVCQQLLIHSRLAFKWFLVDPWEAQPVFSQRQETVCVFSLIVAVTGCAITFVFVQLIFGPVTSFEIASSDFPDLFKSIMNSFRSVQSYFAIVVFVVNSNGCIKQVL